LRVWNTNRTGMRIYNNLKYIYIYSWTVSKLALTPLFCWRLHTYDLLQLGMPRCHDFASFCRQLPRLKSCSLRLFHFPLILRENSSIQIINEPTEQLPYGSAKMYRWQGQYYYYNLCGFKSKHSNISKGRGTYNK
jgi:hypothetical protein